MNMTLDVLVDTAKDLVLSLDPLPDPVWKAWEAYSDVERMQLDPIDLPSALHQAKPAEVAKTLAKVADSRARLEAARGVRAEALEFFGRRLVAAVRAAGPELIATNLQPPFAEAAATFEAAHRRLPSKYVDPAKLVQAGSEILAVYEQARTAADVLDAVKAHRDNLVALGVKARNGGPTDAGTLYAVPAHLEAALNAAHALRVTALGNPLGCWGAVLDLDGIEGLALPTPAEQEVTIRDLGPKVAVLAGASAD